MLLSAAVAHAQTNADTPSDAATPAMESGSDNTNIGRWYQVELILFSRQGDSGSSENWPRFPDLSLLDQARPLWLPPTEISELQVPQPAASPAPLAATPLQWPVIDPETGTERPFVVLPRSQLLLQEEANTIDGQRNYSVILHTGWNMPVQGIDNPDFFRLSAPMGSTPSLRTELDGTLRIYVGRFLHVRTELFATDYRLAQEPLRTFFGDDSSGPALTPELATADTRYGPWLPTLRRPGSDDALAPQWVPSRSVRFVADRRMRSNELHYLDHPELGLVIQFTPYDPFLGSVDDGRGDGDASEPSSNQP